MAERYLELQIRAVNCYHYFILEYLKLFFRLSFITVNKHCAATTDNVKLIIVCTHLNEPPFFKTVPQSQAPLKSFETNRWSHVCKCALTCAHIRILSCLCVCVALPILRMATYQFNMLHSPLDSVPVLHHGLSLHSRWLQHGGCDTTLRASTPPCYAISFFLLTPDLLEPSSSSRKETRKTETTSLNSEILSYSCWAFRLHASHLFRGDKLIQFAVSASRLIQQPLGQL